MSGRASNSTFHCIFKCGAVGAPRHAFRGRGRRGKDGPHPSTPDSCVQLLDAFPGWHTAGAAPCDELDWVDPTFPGLYFPYKRVGLAKALGQGTLRQYGFRSPLPQQLAHVSVRRGVLCSCTHLGRKLDSCAPAPSLGAIVNARTGRLIEMAVGVGRVIVGRVMAGHPHGIDHS